MKGRKSLAVRLACAGVMNDRDHLEEQPIVGCSRYRVNRIRQVIDL